MSKSAVLRKAEMLEAITSTASELAMCDTGPQRTYTRVADDDAEFPFIVWTGTTETGEREGYYGRAGRQGTETFHCWGRDLDQAQQVFEAMVALFHHRRHPITEHLALLSTVAYVTDLADPNGEGVQVTGLLRLRTVELA